MKIQDVTDFIHFASTDVKIDAAKTIVAGGVGGGVSHMTPDELQSLIIFAVTLIYLIWQMLLLIPKTIREYKEFKKDRLKP